VPARGAVAAATRCAIAVSSRRLLERVDFESMALGSPGIADEFVWGEASEGFEASGEVVGLDEVMQMGAQLLVGFVAGAFDGRVFDGAVHSLDLAVIRYEIPRRHVVRLFLKETTLW